MPASGTFSVGSGLDYDTWTAAAAAITDPLTGDLTFEGNAESTSISTDVQFVTQTSTNRLTLTHETGDRHDGTGVDNGCRVTFTGGDSFDFNEVTAGDLANVSIIGIAFDLSTGGNHTAIDLADLNDTGTSLVDGCIIVGDSGDWNGIRVGQGSFNDMLVMNNIVDGVGSGSTTGGIYVVNGITAGDSIRIYNNTCVNCYNNFHFQGSFNSGTLIVKNNMAQDSGTGNDYEDGGMLADVDTTHAFNISEDTTSPDASYQSKDLHTNTIFNNYAAGDFTLDSAGDVTNLAIADDGENLFAAVPHDIIDVARDDGTPFWIGASHIVAAAGRTTKNTDAYPLGINVGMSWRMPNPVGWFNFIKEVVYQYFTLDEKRGQWTGKKYTGNSKVRRKTWAQCLCKAARRGYASLWGRKRCGFTQYSLTVESKSIS